MSELCDLPTWVQVSSALLTPAVAVAALSLGVINWQLSVRRRKDDLFDRRYAFYKKLSNRWLNTANWEGTGEDNSMDAEDVISFAIEASFLFGDDIVRHIMSLEQKEHSGSQLFPNQDFVKPFERYLNH